MAAEFGSKLVLPCDVAEDAQITELFQCLEKSWDSLDALVHSVAYAPADQLEGDYLGHIHREGFRIAHDISSYSLAHSRKPPSPFAKKSRSGRPYLKLFRCRTRGSKLQRHGSCQSLP